MYVRELLFIIHYNCVPHSFCFYIVLRISQGSNVNPYYTMMLEKGGQSTWAKTLIKDVLPFANSYPAASLYGRGVPLVVV
jgi:hypothetical protein